MHPIERSTRSTTGQRGCRKRKGSGLGYADTLAAAWALVQDNRHRNRPIGWLRIDERETDCALFEQQEAQHELEVRAHQADFGKADD